MKDNDELVLMEADTLGGLDTDFVTPSWTKEQNAKYLEDVRNKRFPKFISPQGKHAFGECFKKRLNA